MNITKDTFEKSVVKTLSYRLSSSLITSMLIYIFTRQWKISFFIGGIDFFVKLIWYYAHERLWNHSDWGETLPKKSKK